MAVFHDARCPKCNKKIGWMGDLKDRPPCPQCGHQIPLEELERAEKEMEILRASLLEEDDEEGF